MALLACARIGAPHSVVFGGFSSDSLRDRIQDAEAKVVITADGAWRRGQVVPLKQTTDARGGGVPVDREGARAPPHRAGRRPDDRRSRRLVARPRSPADHRLPAGGDGRRGPPVPPLHERHDGEAQGHHAHDRRLPHPGRVHAPARLRPRPRHRRLLVRGRRRAGSPATPTSSTARSRTGRPASSTRARPTTRTRTGSGQIVEKYGVTILYTAPTAIRTFMKWGPEYVEQHDLSSLRLLGSVGEPINPEAWVWYWQHIGGGRCPVVDTWWQTETGAIMISPLPGATTLKPGSATFPLPGIAADVVERRRRVRRRPRRRLPRADAAVAVDAARASGVTRSGTATRTGAASPAGTSPATVPSATTTATTGCSAGSTT